MPSKCHTGLPCHYSILIRYWCVNAIANNIHYSLPAQLIAAVTESAIRKKLVTLDIAHYRPG